MGVPCSPFEVIPPYNRIETAAYGGFESEQEDSSCNVDHVEQHFNLEQWHALLVAHPHLLLSRTFRRTSPAVTQSPISTIVRL